VPAAAVIRRTQALSGFTGRKELRRWFIKWSVKACGSTIQLRSKLVNLSMRGVDGISSVGVKSVDIRRNTDSVGSLLAHY
jgi:hypothetical protein